MATTCAICVYIKEPFSIFIGSILSFYQEIMPNLTHYTFKWLIKDFFDTICTSIQIKVQDDLTA